MSKIYIESLIESYEIRILNAPVFARSNIERALQFALTYNQQPLIDEIKKLILTNDQLIDVSFDKNVWTSSFDLLLNRSPVLVTADEEENSIISLLDGKSNFIAPFSPI